MNYAPKQDAANNENQSHDDHLKQHQSLYLVTADHHRLDEKQKTTLSNRTSQQTSVRELDQALFLIKSLNWKP